MSSECDCAAVLEALTWLLKSASNDLELGDPVPRLCIEELESSGDGIWLWRCKDSWTGISTSKDGLVRLACR